MSGFVFRVNGVTPFQSTETHDRVMATTDVEYRLSAKRVERNVLEAELTEQELWESEEYQRLEQQIQRLRGELENAEA